MLVLKPQVWACSAGKFWPQPGWQQELPKKVGPGLTARQPQQPASRRMPQARPCPDQSLPAQRRKAPALPARPQRPRTWPLPDWRSRCVHMRVSLGSWYSLWASSTCGPAATAIGGGVGVQCKGEEEGQCFGAAHQPAPSMACLTLLRTVEAGPASVRAWSRAGCRLGRPNIGLAKTREAPRRSRAYGVPAACPRVWRRAGRRCPG